MTFNIQIAYAVRLWGKCFSVPNVPIIPIVRPMIKFNSYSSCGTGWLHFRHYLGGWSSNISLESRHAWHQHKSMKTLAPECSFGQLVTWRFSWVTACVTAMTMTPAPEYSFDTRNYIIVAVTFNKGESHCKSVTVSIESLRRNRSVTTISKRCVTSMYCLQAALALVSCWRLGLCLILYTRAPKVSMHWRRHEVSFATLGWLHRS